METLYRRPLPPHAIAFSSADGRQLFAEALATGGLGGYFPLAEQFHTQADPMFCGLGSLVVALNALAIDPGRLWKGPWRWFAEDLLDCCVSLEEIRRRGLDLDELACLARCNGAEVVVHRGSLGDLRASLEAAARGEAVMIASYDRGALDQTGTGHFSPVGGFHAGRDLALVLDVARFKYPPHWVSVERLWRAMQSVDPANGRARGWLMLRRREYGVPLGFTLSCQGTTLQELGARVATTIADVPPTADLPAVARTIAPLADFVLVREPINPSHQAELDATKQAIRSLPSFPRIVDAVGASAGNSRAETITLLVLALSIRLPDHPAIAAFVDEANANARLARELQTLREQLTALAMFSNVERASCDRDCGPPHSRE